MAPVDLAFGIATAFLSGVLAAALDWNFFIFFGASAVIIIVIVIMLRAGIDRVADKKLPWPPAVFLLLALFLGFFYLHFRANLAESRENFVLNQKTNFRGIVTAEPKRQEKFQELTVDLEEPMKGEIEVLTDLFPNYHYGDLLSFTGKIEKKESGAASSYFPKVEILDHHQGFRFKESLLNFKDKLIAQFGEFLPSERAALLSGLTFGARADFSKDFKAQMAASGTTHLVALSGYNISILVLAVAGVFGYFLKRRITFYLTALVIVIFVLMVGAEASVLRAAIMGFLVLLSHEVGRVYSFRNAIVFSALIMVLIDPKIIVSDLGFILSFVSLLGIVYLGPALKKTFRFDDSGFLDWRENLVTTLSAQLAVLPIVVQTFGSFNLLAFLANILILAFVPLTMFLGFLLSGLGLISYYLGFLAAQILNLLLAYEVGVIKFFSYLRVPVGLSFAGFFISAIYYGFLVGLIVDYGQK